MAKDQRELRDLYNGLGDGLSRAIEMVATPGLFGVVGFMIDRRLDLVPWFTVSFLVLALVGVFVRMWALYEQEMQAHDRSVARTQPENGARR
jgi:F0F1-type ATP synthase assembly protein I